METAASQVPALADPGTFEVHSDDLRSRDPLGFPGYADALSRASAKSGADESVTTGRARIKGHEVELATFNFAFMGGSMGEVAGERLARAMERAAEHAVPFVLRTETGGARMQEGMRSLIQMPKVVAARMTLADAHQPFIALLAHPTTGGVFASVASLADVAFAEQGATIGFAGPRVAERVTGRPLPPGSHSASYALDNGMVDDVVSSHIAARRIGEVLACLAPDQPSPAPPAPDAASAAQELDAWQAVQVARERKPSLDAAWDARCPLAGDRAGSVASELRSALVRVAGRRALLLELDGRPLSPAAYRTALRCVQLAGRLRVPVVTLVDTPGADPSARSEAEGIARLIASLTEQMLAAPVPILSVVTGEGGSGGALAFATADLLVAYETSVFSVIGPEGAAEILWKDPARADEAAHSLKPTAHDLKALGIADQVVAGGPTASSVKQVVTYHLDRMPAGSGDSQRRRDRWRKTW